VSELRCRSSEQRHTGLAASRYIGAALPLTVFTYATGPYEEWHRYAWAAALVLIFVVLVLGVGARLAIGRSQLSSG